MSDTRFIHGFHDINARLRQSAGSVQEIYLAAGRQDGRTRDLIRLAEAQGVRVIATDPARLDGMAGSHGKAARHQGVVARVAAAQRHVTLDDVLDTLAEPALLMVIFTTAMISQSTSVATIVETLAHRDFVIYPSLAFAGIAFTFVSFAENARVPVDNPATHLELTMIHEAMILEYSGRHLALIEWAASLKLYAYSCLGLALFFPWGIAEGASVFGLLLAIPALVAKLAIGGALLAGIETLNAKVRIFRAPEFLGTAFLFAVLGLLVRLLLESRV